MAGAQDDKIAEGKLDLVPMIDCIMLLLLFFILTTKFSAEEEIISSILPTDKGQAAGTPSSVKPPQDLNIYIYPDTYVRGEGGVKHFHDRWNSEPTPMKATVRVGNSEQVYKLDGNLLKSTNQGQLLKAHMEELHGYIEAMLKPSETGEARRADLPDVIIHCFSGLEWKYALSVYDAVRAYEARVTNVKAVTPEILKDAREVCFAPPRLRNYHEWELGNELWEILNGK